MHFDSSIWENIAVKTFKSLTLDSLEFWQSVNQTSQDWMRQLMNQDTSEQNPAASLLNDMLQSLSDLGGEVALDPVAVIGEQLNLLQRQSLLWQRTLLRMTGQAVDPVIQPGTEDKRFNAPEWSDNPVFDYLKQQYLLHADSLFNLIKSSSRLDDKAKDRLEFVVRHFLNAYSPSNFSTTNPEVLRRILETNGTSLTEGMEMLLHDLRDSAAGLNVTMTDLAAFKLGRNLAVTPGQVVYQNDLLQLIQYAPSTEQVNATPLLIVPPFINKYYVFDLRPENSIARWLVEQGHTLFVISWVNPGWRHRDKTFADYLVRGVVESLGVIRESLAVEQVNAIGYCLGGMLLGPALAYLQEQNKPWVKSASYLATLFDFEDPGEIKVFLTDTSLQWLEQHTESLGYLDGRLLAFGFNLLRENDFFWSYFVNNYLKGERPEAFDLLFWNSDNTNISATIHSWYLRNLYLYNRLRKPGAIQVDEVPIDLGSSKVPSYFLATAQDHISPWKSVYQSMHLINPDQPEQNRFVLTASGHVAGVVNHPDFKKYGYWSNSQQTANPVDWYNAAKRCEGSWWIDWQNWIQDYSGELVAARTPGAHKNYPAIEPAPGTYVRVRVKDITD